ncbi:MAG: hypothetical protein D6766_13385 [Verrucomicrobia bacterium]|nr:MAG: hypothetical protein D6766_13385 [Verrucomicrobiota bacterium]
MNPAESHPLPEETSAPGPRVKIVGVGTAGLRAVEHLAARAAGALPLAVVHTDARLLQQCAVAERVLLGEALTRGWRAGDPDVARAVAEGETERLQALAAGADLLLVVAGLGGSTGSGVTPVLARVARDQGCLVLGVVTTPLELEGRHRARQAEEALRRCHTAADAVVVLPNQRVIRLVGEDCLLQEAFDRVNDVLAEGLLGLTRLAAGRGIVSVGFAELCETLRGRHSESVLATGEAAGEGRVREAWKRVLACPFLGGAETLAQAQNVLLWVEAGSLPLKELSHVMEEAARHCDDRNILMGAATDPALGDRLRLVLVGAVHSHADAPAWTPPPEDPETEIVERPASSAEREPPRARRFVPPPPKLTPEETARLFAENKRKGKQRKTASPRNVQFMLPLEVVRKERFEKCDPTRYRGEDLDVPTFVRRGVRLN